MINPDHKPSLLNLSVVILSIYVLGALMADTFWKLSPEISRLLNYFDYAVCAFFFVEFWYRFAKAESKRAFMKWGWIDLLSSIPMVDFLRVGRLLRLIRLIRVVRAFKSTHALISHVFRSRAQGALVSVTVLSVLVLIFSAIAILEVEDAQQSNIKSAEDAIWWAYSTITTVGYGDLYPVTSEGRMVAMLLMTFGVGFFGTFTAYIASLFIAPHIKKEELPWEK